MSNFASMTEKDLHKLLKKIENSQAIDNISDIARMMSNIVVNDKNMSMENKMRFVFLYCQLKNECRNISEVLLSPNKQNNSIVNKIMSIFFK